MKKLILIAAVALVLVWTAVSGGLVGWIADIVGGNLLTTASSAEAVTTATKSAAGTASTGSIVTSGTSALDTADLFGERDLEQTADLSEAESVALVSGEDVTISTEGVYVLSGTVSDVTVTIDAGEDAKVQLVLDGVSITNENAPAIYVASADKVFVTLTDSTNRLEVSGSFENDSLDAVVMSRSDLTLNGIGSLEIISAEGNGITSNDDLKITGGTYAISAASDGLKANNSIRIYAGTFAITAGKDALHSENNEDSTLGYIYLYDASLEITAGDDGIQGNAIVQIDGGTININTCTEGIESTYIQINGGVVDIYATDDGMNAAQKSAYDMLLEINGGTITIDMASGDTDALDSNGSLIINGGTLNITANSAFDFNITGILNGGTVTVNGQTVTQLTSSQPGGGDGKMGRHGGL